MNTIEIELRYEILNPEALHVVENTCSFISEKRVVDQYLDTPWIHLLKKGIYIRVRDSKKMDIKFNRECLINPLLELQDSCEEYTFPLPLQNASIDSCNEILTFLELQPLTSPDLELFKEHNQLFNHRVVDKIRKTYTTNGFTIMVDTVADLGSFLEIEVMASPSENVEAVAQRMREYILSLNALHLKPLKTGYDSLILRKHKYSEYIQGRFILEEDKHDRTAL